jgi:predicted Zn-dependent protease
MLASCGSGSGGGFNLMSLEEEWQLGQQLSQEVASQVHLNNDPTANAYIRSLGQRLVAQTPMANLPWTFHVVDDPAINAFAIPGGHVYVNTGLINAASNASELAGVMGHEIAHGVARHSTQQMSAQYGLSALASVLLGQNAGNLQQIAAQIVAGGALARFSRGAEREADERGIQYMHAAGFNAGGMASMFRKLAAQSQRQPGALEKFFSTHPVTEERIRDAEKRAAGLSGGVTDEAAFQNVKSRV